MTMQINDTINHIINKYSPQRQENLVSILLEIQEQFGYIPEQSIKYISKHLNLPGSTVYGVISFYHQFRLQPRGKYHIQLCYGTACYLFGASNFLNELHRMINIKDGEISTDGLFSLELQSCIGGCGQAPVISINGEYYGNLTLEKLQQIIENIRLNEEKTILLK